MPSIPPLIIYQLAAAIGENISGGRCGRLRRYRQARHLVLPEDRPSLVPQRARPYHQLRPPPRSVPGTVMRREG